MSIHKSLKIGDSLARRRSVLRRAERVEKMLAAGTLADDQSVYGLPKLRVFVKVAKKKKKKEAEAEATAEGAVETEGAAPAADAAKKKG